MNLNKLTKQTILEIYRDLFLELNQTPDMQDDVWLKDFNKRAELFFKQREIRQQTFLDKSNSVEIEIDGGLLTLVDPVDSDVAQFRWYPLLSRKTQKIYAVTDDQRSPYSRLNRLILSRMLNRNLESKDFADHINGNSLDNRRCNLRLATPAQNTVNRKKLKTNTSGFKGVSRNGKRWRATISVNSQQIHLGNFDTPEEASEAFKKASIAYYGEFANVD